MIIRSFGQRPSLKNTAPETRGRARAAAPAGGSQGNRGFIAAQAGTAAPSQGRTGRGGLASGVQEVDAAPWQEAYVDPDHPMPRRVGDQKFYDALVVRDRHMMSKTGTEGQQAHPDQVTAANGGRLNPLADGPVRPSFVQVNRSYYPRRGNTASRHEDNSAPHATVPSSDGRPQPAGQQDGTTLSTYGGARNLTHVYGVRGPAGAQGPELGSPEDGPQAIASGAPHGLHSPSQPNTELTRQRYARTAQQRRRTASYPANSKVAGQSYSQTVMPLGGSPTPVPKTTSRRPGLQGRGLAR